MSRKIKKLYENQKNAHEIIDYLNDTIKDLDVEIRETKEKGVQEVVPTFCIMNATDSKQLMLCKQFPTIDKVMVIIRGNYNSRKKEHYKTHNYSNLDEVKEFNIDDVLIKEKYEKLISQEIKDNEKKISNSKRIEERYNKLLARLKNSFNETSPTKKESIVKRRIGQNILRDILLSKKCECKVCNMADKKLLIASHIKPWSQSNDYERLDENNAFLLCPNHDSLFDKGYMSFDENGKILISNRISDDNKILLNIHEDMMIELKDENQKYLEWHRKNLFE